MKREYNTSDDSGDKVTSGGIADSCDGDQKAENKRTRVLNAMCVSQNIRSPRDISLLNEAREKT